MTCSARTRAWREKASAPNVAGIADLDVALADVDGDHFTHDELVSAMGEVTR
jgi:hypothetical protein